jgi:hypothetical protein
MNELAGSDAVVDHLPAETRRPELVEGDNAVLGPGDAFDHSCHLVNVHARIVATGCDSERAGRSPPHRWVVPSSSG